VSIEADIYNALKGPVAGRCFPDVAPISTARPYITFVQVGGEAVNLLENSLASKQNGRFQVNVFSDTRATASALMLQIEAVLVTSPAFAARPVSAPSSDYDHDMTTYVSMQDFSVWSNR